MNWWETIKEQGAVTTATAGIKSLPRFGGDEDDKEIEKIVALIGALRGKKDGDEETN